MFTTLPTMRPYFLSLRTRITGEKSDVDDELIKKLDDDALVNLNVLGPRERARGRELLLKASKSNCKEDGARLKKWRAALATHKLLPFEILREIFLFSMSAQDVPPVTFPATTSAWPWALRSVCYVWRQVAIKETYFWHQHSINLNGLRADKVIDFFKHLIPSKGLLVIKFHGSGSYEDTTRALRELVIPHIRPCFYDYLA
ncbi:hypothetical protein D9615_008773 [Tricholomella constricta]|uniref:F-box domain-containing protein n=1 Tax=Tricholomella constricta TaxID=117010 RepID=A0A8H5H7Z7_9AGAR|nr:hypothetical protein D9615_008773 [Tricholomella constricta]